MSNLKGNTFQEIICILGNTSYASETNRAEDIADIFDEVPKRAHLATIIFILSFHGDYMIPGNTEGMKAEYRVSDEDISFVRTSMRLGDFMAKAYRALDRNSPEELAAVISSHLENASDFVHRIAIFLYVITDLKMAVLVHANRRRLSKRPQ